ncbi:MaoC/PaaZ C-terminal domain-containing protein [Nocardioides sp.]|uniref:MaoC/PaaZ C-terminal domain-containing protein n=1 Tax=Nocardioides sp. TaxID=35761 RepID=UPI0025D3DD48|nr:MaoC/PaaZ C-terminal domain-containing protein [Nocardioides sp.]
MAGAGDWAGRELGTRTVGWSERDVLLYALAVGARADQLDLVFERDLRVLPTFGLTLAQWAPDLLGSSGAFEVGRAVHGSQSLEVHEQLPTAGELELTARVARVWDKGAAAVFEVEVACAAFTATWGIFAPGAGGFGGDRGPGRVADPDVEATARTSVRTAENQALLYRLLGDRHHIHVDPVAAAAIGQPRPILHGLATLATSALAVAESAGAHPADLSRLEGRFASVVFPGDELELAIWDDGRFTSTGPQGVAICAGRAHFG